jgi:hypothetical protein
MIYNLVLKVAILLLCARLWRMSGSAKYKGHWHRCMAAPGILAWYLIWNTPSHWWTFFALLAGWQVTRIGYGIPDDPLVVGQPDPGSFLGRLFGTEAVTRGVVGILYSLPALIVIPVDRWWIYAWFQFFVGFQGSLVKSILRFSAHQYETAIGLAFSLIIWFV